MRPGLAISDVTGPGVEVSAVVSGITRTAYRDHGVGFRATTVSIAGRVVTELFDTSRPPIGESEGKDGYNGVEGV